MARNVGAIEITVDANTGKLKAQVTRAGQEAGRAGGKAIEEGLSDVDGRELIAKLRKIRIEAERAVAGVAIDIDVNAAEVKGDLKKLEAQLRAAQLELLLHPEIDQPQLQRELAQARTQLLDALEAPVESRLDRRALAELVVEAKGLLDMAGLAIEGQISIPTDEEVAFFAEVDRIAAQARVHVPVSVDVEMGSILRARRLMEEGMARIHAEIIADVDESSLVKARAQAEAAGRQAGKGFGGGFRGGFDETKIALEAIAIFGEAIATGLTGVSAAGTAVISSAFSAVGAAAGAATPLIAGFGQAITAVVVGTQGFGTAMGAITEEFNAAQEEGREMNLRIGEAGEALRNLSPAARAAAEAFADMRGALEQTRLDVQQQLFAGMARTLDDLAADVLPSVTDGLITAADSVNHFGQELARVATGIDFGSLAKDLDPAFDDALDAALALVETVEPFLRAAAKPAERLAEMIERVAEAMRDWTIANASDITRFLDDGLTSLERWGDLLASTGDLLATVFDAGRESGDSFVISLNNLIERWDHFLESTEGEDALAEFFDRGEAVMKAFRPVLDGVKEAFQDLVDEDALRNFEQLMGDVGDAIPAIGSLLEVLSELSIGSAFSNLLQALNPVFDLIGALPPEVLAMAGAFTVALRVVKLFDKAIGGLAGAFTKTNAVLALAGVALAAAIQMYDTITQDSRDAEEATRDFGNALGDAVDRIITSGEVAAGASVGWKALNEAIGGTALSDAVQKAGGDFEIGSEQIVQSLLDIRTRGRDALVDMATDLGLPVNAAEQLADAVIKTEGDFSDSWVTLEGTTGFLKDLGKQTGMTTEDTQALAHSMEVLRDAANDVDFEATIQGEIDLAEGGTAAEQSAIAQAKALQESGEIAEGVVPLFMAYTRILNETAQTTDDTAAAELNLATATEIITQAILDAQAATQERNTALKEERDKAYDAYIAERDLADQTERVAVEAAAAMGFSEDLATDFIDLGNAARDAADDAEHFISVMELLVSPAVNVEEAFSNLQENIDEFDKLIVGGEEAIRKREDATEKLAEADRQAAKAKSASSDAEREAAEERATELRNEAKALQDEADALQASAKTLDLTTEAGRAHAAQLRDSAKETFNWAAAMISEGQTAEDVAAQVAIHRQTLEDQAEAYGLGETEAKAYIDRLLGTPDLMTTVISTPGLVDALLNAEELTLLYDDLGQPVLKEFETLGLDPALATSQEFKDLLEELDLIEASPEINPEGLTLTEEEAADAQTALETLSTTNASPTVSLPEGATVLEQIGNLQTATNNLDVSIAAPHVLVDGYFLADANLDSLQDSLTTLDATTASASVTVIGLDSALTKVGELQTALDNLGSVGAVGADQPGGGDFPPGGMAGAMITRPTLMNVGERGYREALIPLDLPLNRVDPSVRELAALLRGLTGGVATGPTRQVNNYMTIQPAAADPSAVATQVINRAVAMASR